MPSGLPPLVTCPASPQVPRRTAPPPPRPRAVSDTQTKDFPRPPAALCPKSKFGWIKPSINVKLAGVSCQFLHTHARALPQRNLLPRLVRGRCSADRQIFFVVADAGWKLQKYKNNYKFFEILV